MHNYVPQPIRLYSKLHNYTDINDNLKKKYLADLLMIGITEKYGVKIIDNWLYKQSDILSGWLKGMWEMLCISIQYGPL